MAGHDHREAMRRAFREGDAPLRRRIVEHIIHTITEHHRLEPRVLYRFLLDDPDQPDRAALQQAQASLASAAAYLGVDPARLRELVAEALGAQLRRYVLDPRSGLYQDREQPGRYLSAAEARFEQLLELRLRAQAAIASGQLPDARIDIPDHLPADLDPSRTDR